MIRWWVYVFLVLCFVVSVYMVVRSCVLVVSLRFMMWLVLVDIIRVLFVDCYYVCVIGVLC